MKLNQRNNRVATPFGDFQFDVDNLFDQVFGSRYNKEHGATSERWIPRVSVTESEQGYEMLVELPGVDPESVNLEMHDNRLEVSGEKALPELEEGVKAIRQERAAGKFSRSFEFGQQVDADKIEATYDHGLLRINLPKSETVLPRRIEVKVAK